MKKSKKLASLIMVVLCFVLLFSSPSVVFAATVDMNCDETLLVSKYINAINNGDVDTYISLFTQDNQNEMISYINANGKGYFFQESNIELINITKLSELVGKYSSGISDDEISKYGNMLVFYTEMDIAVKNDNGSDNDDILDTGYAFRNIIIVKEDDEWKILRVSSPALSVIVDAKEGFGTTHEKIKIEEQRIKTQLKISEVSKSIPAQFIVGAGSNAILATPPNADPTAITVYFTKSANSSYYGVSNKSLDWTTYIKNVIPNEWIVSYFASYPAYLYAGSMASKMYAWWYIIHPKWNYAPYYSMVKDSSADQNFLYNAYSSMSSTYRGYVDQVLYLLEDFAMCRNDGVMFEVHYYANTGTLHSGKLNAAGALSLAQSGYSMWEILDYYYSYSPYTGAGYYITLFGW